MQRDVYFGSRKVNGEEDAITLREADNYAIFLLDLKHYAKAKSLLRKTMPVARRVLGRNDLTTLRMLSRHARALGEDPDATIDDLREGVTTLEEIEPTAPRLLGDAHPDVVSLEKTLRGGRAALRARETPSGEV